MVSFLTSQQPIQVARTCKALAVLPLWKRSGCLARRPSKTWRFIEDVEMMLPRRVSSALLNNAFACSSATVSIIEWKWFRCGCGNDAAEMSFLRFAEQRGFFYRLKSLLTRIQTLHRFDRHLGNDWIVEQSVPPLLNLVQSEFAGELHACVNLKMDWLLNMIDWLLDATLETILDTSGHQNVLVVLRLD